MITFILLAVFAIIGIAFFVVAYSANQRKRAGQSGTDFIHYQRSQYPRRDAAQPLAASQRTTGSAARSTARPSGVSVIAS